MTRPTFRISIDHDDDLFICRNALTSDALNTLHNTYYTGDDVGLTNLHWNSLNVLIANSATSVEIDQLLTEYGVRLLRCVTGTGTTAGAYFGWSGSGDKDIKVTASATYTAVLWIRATVGAGVDMLLAMENSVGSASFTLTTDWQKVTRTFTPSADNTAFKITKDTDATDVTFEATGFMVVAGSSAPNGFNAGHPTNPYDNISADALRWDTIIGKTRWRDLMPDEGRLNLTLKNADRKYSPEYSSSPVFGYLRQGLLVNVEVQNPTTSAWVTLFAGWISDINPSYGQRRDQQAHIECEQGLFRLEKTPFRQAVSGDVTADEIISQIVLAAYTSTVTPLQTVLNRARLNACYYVDPDGIMNLDPGLSTIPLSGEWKAGPPTGNEKRRDVMAARCIADVMEVERGWWFINRAGVICFYNRTHYVDADLSPAAQAVSLDNEAVDGKYRHGADVFNTVRMTYKPYSVSNGILWQSRGTTRVKAAEKTRTLDVEFEYTEGKKLTATGVNAFDADDEPSTLTVRDGSGRDITSKCRVEITDVQNGRAKLVLSNYSQTAAYFEIVLRGPVIESFGGQTVEVVDADGISGGVHLLTDSVKLINNEDDATNLANHLLYLHKDQVGEYTHFTIKNRNVTWLERALALEVGALVTLDEYQTAHSGDYVVIGEKHNYNPGELDSTFYVYPLVRDGEAWIVGQSVLGTDTVLRY